MLRLPAAKYAPAAFAALLALTLTSCGSPSVNLAEPPGSSEAAAATQPSAEPTATSGATSVGSPSASPAIDPCQELSDAVDTWVALVTPRAAYREVERTAKSALRQLKARQYSAAYRSLTKALPAAVDDLPEPMAKLPDEVYNNCADTSVKGRYATATQSHADLILNKYQTGLAGSIRVGSLESWLDDYRTYGPAPVMDVETRLVLDAARDGYGLPQIIDSASGIANSLNT